MSPQETSILERLFGAGVAEHFDTNIRLIVLPVVPLPTGCKPPIVTGMYVPQSFMGYDTRLFFEAPITLASGAQPAVTTAVLLGRTMYAASIRGIPMTLPLHQGILAHLRRYELAS